MVTDIKFLKRKTEEFNDSDYSTFITDFESLVTSIVNHSKAVAQKHGLQNISCRPHSRELVNLCEKESLNTAFQKRILKKKKAWLRTLKNYYEIEIRAKTFDEYVASQGTDMDSIEKKVELEAWDSFKGILFEWSVLASLLHGLKRYVDFTSTRVCVGKNEKPLLVELANSEYFLWYQKTFETKVSGLDACPDITITDNEDSPTSKNIAGIIECKNLGSVGGKLMWEMSGKADDIDTRYTILCSYSSVGELVKEGADRLGLTLLENPISTDRRGDILAKKVLLMDVIRSTIEKAAKDQPFRNRELKSQRL